MTDPAAAGDGRLRRGAIRLALALVAVVLVAIPVSVAWYLHVVGLQVGKQQETPATVLTAGQAAAAAAAGAGLPDRTAPVVLAYHDIRPVAATTEYPDPAGNPHYRLVVTPEMFDAQLTALQAAGYTSITSQEYVAYLRGGAIPRRSVLITFDDGTHGLWTHADKILQRHGMHGVAFLITGDVGKNRPYYLSWQEIDRMAASGRWDFQSHTHKMHARLPVDANGTLASELVSRRWLFEKSRRETLGEFEQKIRHDLSASVADIVDHGLPRPTLFAFPFSEGYRGSDGGDPQAAAVTARVINELFVGSFNNATPRPSPAGARAAAVGMVDRIEVTHSSTVQELLEQVRRRTPVSPAQASPANRPDLWRTMTGGPPPVTVSGDEVRLLGPGRWRAVAWGLQATADWASYRGSVTVSGLAADTDVNGSLITRVGTANPVSVQVSDDYVRLVVDDGRDQRTIAAAPLPAAGRHLVEFTVSPTATTVVVDGLVRLAAPADGRPDSYGGIGLSSHRDAESVPWPVFRELNVSKGADSPTVRSGVGIPATV